SYVVQAAGGDKRSGRVMDLPSPGSHTRHPCHSSFQEHISICEKGGRTLSASVLQKARTQNSAVLIEDLPRRCVARAPRNKEGAVLQKRGRMHRTRIGEVPTLQASTRIVVTLESSSSPRYSTDNQVSIYWVI